MLKFDSVIESIPINCSRPPFVPPTSPLWTPPPPPSVSPYRMIYVKSNIVSTWWTEADLRLCLQANYKFNNDI